MLHLGIIIYPLLFVCKHISAFFPVTAFLKYNYYQMVEYHYSEQLKGSVLSIVGNLLSLEPLASYLKVYKFEFNF